MIRLYFISYLCIFPPTISDMFLGVITSILFSCVTILIEHEAGDGLKTVIATGVLPGAGMHLVL